MMTRREARETVFTLLYEYDYNRVEGAAAVYDNAKSVRGFEDDEYIKLTYTGACLNEKAIDARIESAAVNWRVGRMASTTRAILRLAVYELLYNDDIPAAVAIDEAVELAKAYDDDGAPAFVNGILSALNRQAAEADAK